MAAVQAVVQVTLRCSDALDDYDRRSLTLRPEHHVQIGRASKNTAKRELMIGPGNAYIDSPTISREHAVLTVTSPPAPCVCITDMGSMHGTMVNGNRLVPHKPHALSNGDALQFGADVSREAVFYTARAFTFESSLPTYPSGITVPDSASSDDDEDIDVDEAMSCPPPYGTQMNPVTIDTEIYEPRSSKPEVAHPDFHRDDGFDDVQVDSDILETTMPLNTTDEIQQPEPLPNVGVNVFCSDIVRNTFTPPARGTFIEDASSDDGVPSDDLSEEEESSVMDTAASMADSEIQSEPDRQLENDDEDDQGVAAPMVPPAQSSKAAEGPFVASFNMRDDSSELGPSVPLAPFASLGSTPLPVTKAEPPRLLQPDVPCFNSIGMFGAYDRVCFDSRETIPRPAAPRPTQWGIDYTSPFAPPANMSSFANVYSPNTMTNYTGAPHLYPTQPPFPASPSHWTLSHCPSAANVDNPTRQPARSSDIASPPVRRTEVSIREIVEDATPQLPTPNSESGGVKRKADVLNEEVDEIRKQSAPTIQSSPAVVGQDPLPTEAIGSHQAALSQRPKKRLRTRLGSVAKMAAAWMVPGVVGAASAVAFLTSVPNDFFVA